MYINEDTDAGLGKRKKNANLQNYRKIGDGTENDTGHRLTDICQSFSTKILSGHFQHQDIHPYT